MKTQRRSEARETWVCNACGNVEHKEREVACWECGKGEMIYERIKAGQLWDFSGENQRGHGTYRVVEPNTSRESPGSWVMHRVTDGKIAYMHVRARRQGEWKRTASMEAHHD